MNIAFHSIWPYEREFFFEEDSSILQFGDKVWEPMVSLKKFGKLRGVNFGRVTEFPIDTIHAFVFHEIPEDTDVYFRHALKKNIPMFLYNYEPETVYTRSHDLSNHAYFARIFTQHDEYIRNDSERYIRINPFCIDVSKPIQQTNKDTLCTLISSNKSSPHPLELYSERARIIEWFEINYPFAFEYYGHGWETDSSPCYKGIVKNKVETLSKYKFAICYENCKDVSGYITEKILDCFRAGCVPVYWGADNVTDYIPPTCFIDRRKFKDHNELYLLLSEMDATTYQGYLDSIDRFISTNHSFTTNNFVYTMWNGLMDGLKTKLNFESMVIL